MAFDKMRLLKLKVILSTDLMSRGVDLPEVSMVLNYDMPVSHAQYLHRIGRAGRFGLKGLALSFTSNKG
jgi:ATP-dependent RNA helicase UAP56/SUB2